VKPIWNGTEPPGVIFPDDRSWLVSFFWMTTGPASGVRRIWSAVSLAIRCSHRTHAASIRSKTPHHQATGRAEGHNDSSIHRGPSEGRFCGVASAVRWGADRQRRVWLQEAIADPKTVQRFCLPSVVALSNP
jgi:hypothetical protein